MSERQLTVDGFEIRDGSDCYVIAEIGHNHQGNLEKAKQLIHAAKECGADAVKFQKRDNRTLYTREFYDSPYENENSFGRTYGAHRESLELGHDEWRELRAYARELGIGFVATPFDRPSADFLAELDLTAFKFASGDLRNTPLQRQVASFGKPMFLSTGGGELADIDRAGETILPLNRQLAVLQCTAAYPAAAEDLNLKVITTLPRDREALHARPRVEGHRPCFLADAGGTAAARPRSAPRPDRPRRRRQAAAPGRAEAAREDGEEAGRRARPGPGPRPDDGGHRD